jgi:hypothetical protein
MADKLHCLDIQTKIGCKLSSAQKLDFGDNRNLEAIGEYGVDRFVICQTVEIVNDDIGIN